MKKKKKLEETLEKLKNLEIPNSNKIIELEKLENQKNQLEIEKKQIEARCDTLEKENEILKLQFDEFKKREIEEKREEQFSEKIDELNQETDNLMDEIEKMGNVNIKFNGKEFLLSCENGQEEHLEELALYLNEKFTNLKKSLGNIGESKLLLITSISVLDEYYEISKKIDLQKRYK